jgi:hypothetical protein
VFSHHYYGKFTEEKYLDFEKHIPHFSDNLKRELNEILNRFKLKPDLPTLP